MTTLPLTAGLCRRAREALDWNVLELARRVMVSPPVVTRCEAETGQCQPPTLAAIRQAFEAAGVEFLGGEEPGERLKEKP